MLRELTVYGRSHYAVVRRTLDMLIRVAQETSLACRRRLLGVYGRRVFDEAAAHLAPRDRAEVGRKLQELYDALGSPAVTPRSAARRK